MSEVSNMKMQCNQALIFPPHLKLSSLSYFSHYASERWPLPHPWRWVWAGCPSQTCPAECLMTGCLWNSCVLFVPSPFPCPCWQCPHCESEGACFVSPASLEPVLVQRELAHTFAHSVRASVDLPAHYLTFCVHYLSFVGGFEVFNVQCVLLCLVCAAKIRTLL